MYCTCTFPISSLFFTTSCKCCMRSMSFSWIYREQKYISHSESTTWSTWVEKSLRSFLNPPMTSNGRVCLLLDRHMRPGLNGREQRLTNQRAPYCVWLLPLSPWTLLIMRPMAYWVCNAKARQRALILWFSECKTVSVYCAWCVLGTSGFVSVSEQMESPNKALYGW